MKRLILLLALLFPIAAQATTIPITGTISGPDGSMFTGTVVFTLSYSAAHDTTNNNLVVAQRVTFPVIQGKIAGNAQIVPNTDLIPMFTYYTVDYIDQNSANVAENIYYISGTSFDIGAAIPTPVVTQNISFSSIPNFWERQQDFFLGSPYFDLYPQTTTDRVLVGVPSSDVPQQSAMISPAFYTISGELNAGIGGLLYDSGIGSGVIALATGHTGSGTTPPIDVVADGSVLCEFYPAGGLTCGNPTGGNQGLGTANFSGGVYLNGVPIGGGGGTNYFSRTLDGTYYDLLPAISSNDRIVMGSPAGTDLDQPGVLISAEGSYVISSNVNASAIGLEYDQANSLMDVGSFHTGTGTTLGIGFRTDTTILAELYPGGGYVGAGATGGDQGLGTGNFTGLYVNGVPVSGSGGTSGWTVNGSYIYPNSLTQTVITGATSISSISTANSAGMIIAVKPASAVGGITVVSGSNTAANSLTMTQSSSVAAITENFGTGGALVPWVFNMGLTDSITIDTSGDVTIADGLTDLGYTLGVNGTFDVVGTSTHGGASTFSSSIAVTGAATMSSTLNVATSITTGAMITSTLAASSTITSTATSAPAFAVLPGNGITFGTYEAIYNDVADTALTFDANVSSARLQVAVLNGTGLAISRSSGAGGQLLVSNATGGFQGEGTINAKAYYVNGSLLSGGIGGAGSSGTCAFFTGTTSVGNGPCSVSGSTVTIADNLIVSGSLNQPLTINSSGSITGIQFNAGGSSAGLISMDSTEFDFCSATGPCNSGLAIANNGTGVNIFGIGNSGGSYYLCQSGAGQILWNTVGCGTDNIAQMKSDLDSLKVQYQELQERLDALTNQAVATKKEQQ